MLSKIKSFGETARSIRESKGLLLWHVAAELEVDMAFLSKIESNEKKFSRLKVERLPKTLEFAMGELLPLWLSDKLLDPLNDESDAINAIKLTEKRKKI
jgi:transcriptional regulator with XRE-family HTH domain